jgi:hypothetical protein
VDVFSRHFEILRPLVVWDRLTVVALTFIALCAVV